VLIVENRDVFLCLPTVPGTDKYVDEI